MHLCCWHTMPLHIPPSLARQSLFLCISTTCDHDNIGERVCGFSCVVRPKKLIHDNLSMLKNKLFIFKRQLTCFLCSNPQTVCCTSTLVAYVMCIIVVLLPVEMLSVVVCHSTWCMCLYERQPAGSITKYSIASVSIGRL